MSPLRKLSDAQLVEYVTAQRWYGSKGREVSGADVVDHVELPGVLLALVEIVFPEGTHDVYQVLAGETLDGLAEPAVARELVHLIRTGKPQRTAGEGTVDFHHVEGFAALGSELVSARMNDAEQSNSSVVFDDALFLKAFRRLEPGTNPELEMLRFLTEHGFANIPPLGGWYSYAGPPLEATLGILQEFVANSVDGWELALDELAEAPDRFLGRLRRLGEVVGTMHAVLASDPGDPNFCPETPSLESLGLLTASVDEEIEQLFLTLPDDLDALEPIRGRGEEIRDRLRQLTHAGTTGKAIRNHGDLHLGQTLWETDGEDWVILDFEGEPARSLAERRRKRSPLRDVAGMLRSFAYATSAVSFQRGAEAPRGWEEHARSEFLEGYLEKVDPAIIPVGQEQFEKLLAVFELEKAVYELRYELSMRPDWLPIPVAGVLRMLEEAVTT
jgi:trehalose synthase-fused probable maltokinase